VLGCGRKEIRMRAPARKRMTTDEFLAWAAEQPEGERYELVAGEVVAMAPERLGHARVKHQDPLPRGRDRRGRAAL
jgi:hypothetical protein